MLPKAHAVAFFGPTHRGRCDEWHVVLLNAFCDFTFGLRSGFPQEAVMFGTPFSEAWLESVGAVCDSVDGNCIEQVVVQLPAKSLVTLTLECDYGLEGF